MSDILIRNILEAKEIEKVKALDGELYVPGPTGYFTAHDGIKYFVDSDGTPIPVRNFSGTPLAQKCVRGYFAALVKTLKAERVMHGVKVKETGNKNLSLDYRKLRKTALKVIAKLKPDDLRCVASAFRDRSGRSDADVVANAALRTAACR